MRSKQNSQNLTTLHIKQWYIYRQRGRVHIRRDDENGPIAGALSPSLNHINQFNKCICRSGNFVSVRPGSELKDLGHFRFGFNACHQFCERRHLFIDFENPWINTRRTVPRHCFHRECRTVFLGFDAFLWPELGVILNNKINEWILKIGSKMLKIHYFIIIRNSSQNDNWIAVVIVYKGPDIRHSLIHWPFRCYIFFGTGIALKRK